MPPRKYKVDHRRGGGSKHVSSVEDVKARNNGEMSAYDRARQGGGRPSEAKEKEEEESEEEEAQEKVVFKKKPAAPLMETENPNAKPRNEEKDGVELTRKQREELEKNAARRRYEELHKAGKTDEAKSDLARLEEVKKRREEARLKKEEEAEKERQEQADQSKSKSVLTKELKAAMGSEETRMRGTRSSKEKEKKEKSEKKEKKDKKDDKDADSKDKPSKDDDAKEEGGGRKILNGVHEDDVYSSYAGAVSTKGVEREAPKVATDGTIESCREAESDFM